MADFICLVFGRDDQVLDVHTITCPALADAIGEATRITQGIKQTRGFQVWSGGKVVCSQLAKGGADWQDLGPTIS